MGPPQAGKPWLLILVAAGCVVLGLLMLGPLSTPGGIHLERLGPNVPVNKDAVDRLAVHARNSPAVAMNPTKPSELVVVHRVDTPQPGCGLEVSGDGGGTWETVDIPLPDGKVVPCFSPDVAFTADGALVVAFTSFAEVAGSGTVQDAVWVVMSRDGGRTFSSPTVTAGHLAFQTRVAADPRRPGRLYLAWLQAAQTTSHGLAEFGNPIVVSRSDDGGGTWSAPTRVSAANRLGAVGPSLVVGADGTVYVAYLDVGEDKLDYLGAHEGKGGPASGGNWSVVVARSSDGVAWQESTVDSNVVPAQRFRQVFAPTPALAVGPSSRQVYVSFTDMSPGDPDVWLWGSSDGGTTWAGRQRDNDNRLHDGTTQYLPAISVSPDGRIDVVYYDRRNDPADTMNEVSLQSSTDGGSTFSPSLRLSDRPFDSRIGLGRDAGLPELGNRLGLLSRPGGSLALWSDTRGGNDLLIKQDLASQLVRAQEEKPNALRRYAGLALMATGLAAAALFVIRVGKRSAP